MIQRLRGFFRLGVRQVAEREPAVGQRRLVLTRSCLIAAFDLLRAWGERNHEGIVYLLGKTDITSTVAVAAIAPEAQTTYGSFEVSTRAMARIVRVAARLGLQVVGQVHTHPGEAYHSEGDLEGMRNRYGGYVSLVLPRYGAGVPTLEKASILMCSESGEQEIGASEVSVVEAEVA